MEGRPYKVLHKFKNAHNKYQYLLYVFVGEVFDEAVKSVLERTKNASFLEVLLNMPVKNFSVLSGYFGERWYEQLYVWKHVQFVRKNLSRKHREEIEKRLGEEWVEEHLTARKERQDVLSYPDFVQRKYRIIRDAKEAMRGGSATTIHRSKSNSDSSDSDDEAVDVMDVIDVIDAMDDAQSDVISDIVGGMNEEEVELDDLVDIAQEAVEAAPQQLFMEEKRQQYYVPFKKSKNESYYDEALHEVFERQFIYNFRIYHDDTIEEVREKIFISIQNNSALYESPVTIPPYAQYLWSYHRKQRIALTHTYIHDFAPVTLLGEPENIKSYAKKEGVYEELNVILNKSGRLLQFRANDATILHEYRDYITMNEIYMVDIYNELKNEAIGGDLKSALYNTYLKYYFPLITAEHFNTILEMLYHGDKFEYNRITTLYADALERHLLSGEIMRSVDTLVHSGMRDTTSTRFGQQHMVHCIVYTYIEGIDKITNKNTIDMYRIFDNFEVSDEFPLISYNTPNTDVAQKIYNKVKDVGIDTVKKWIQSVMFGLMFKMKIGEGKYLTVNININKRLEFKAQWRESDHASIEEITSLYAHIRRLFEKINAENTKLQLIIPKHSDYVFSFINLLQEFSIADIDHNKLSDLCRYFFPYVTLVIDPKKRKSKGQQNVNVSKFGTYLRFRRITDYDSISRIEKRILYIIKNYDVREDTLVQIISNEFNVVESVGARIVKETLTKYPNVKKSRYRLKNISELSKLKQSGIGIDIQGKAKTQLKIKYTGLRHIFQAHDIERVMRVVLYVYDQIYNRKNKAFASYVEALSRLTNIAKRKKMVIDRVVEESGARPRLRMEDAERFGKLEGLEWARACQNSGTTRRQPKQYTGAEQLLQQGYRYNEETKLYEREAAVGKKKVLLQAAALEDATGKELYYTCTPEENNDFYHIGFLTKGVGDKCVPCCFKKRQGDSGNKYKKQHYDKCMNQIMTDIYKPHYNVANLKPNDLYLLQPDNRSHNYKFQLLHYHLNILLNMMTRRKYELKKQYLAESPRGVFLKYGVIRKNSLLQCFAMLYDSNEYAIRERILAFDKWHVVKNGELLNRYGASLVDVLRYMQNPSIDELHDVLCYPNVVSPRGINIYLFKRVGDDFFLRCMNYEDVAQYDDETRDVVLLLEERGVYFPILLVKKMKYRVEVMRVFEDDVAKELRTLLRPYLENNCNIVTSEHLVQHYYPKIIYPPLRDVVTHQFLNSRYKCVFLVLESSFLLPVSEGGAVHEVPLIDDINPFKKELRETYELVVRYHAAFPHLRLKPQAVLYNEQKNNTYRVYGLQIDEIRVVPMKTQFLTKEQVYDAVPKSVTLRNELIMSKIDRQIARNSRLYDERVAAMNKHSYETELYELLRLHLSSYLSKYAELRKKLMDVITDKSDETVDERRKFVKLLLLRVLSPKLYSRMMQRSVSSSDDLVVLGEKKLESYQRSNVRELCELKADNEQCDSSNHCYYHNGRCKLMISSSLLLDYINRVTEELLVEGIKREELFNNNQYYVTDIVDTTHFTTRENQSILKREHGRSANIHSEKVLKSIFNTDKDIFDDTYSVRGAPYRIFGNTVEQLIIPNNNTIFRAFANVYYWENSVGNSVEEKNLGYYSKTQTNITNFVKSKVIDAVSDEESMAALEKRYDAETLDVILTKIIMRDAYTPTNLYDIELSLLSSIFHYTIHVLDNKNSELRTYGRYKKEVTIKFELKPESDAIANVFAIYYK